MTKKLEELFDLPQNDDDVVDPAPDFAGETIPDLTTTLDSLDKIESALPAVRGLEASDSEMDALAKKASDSFDDLMDLGMNVDSRYASEIFAVASSMLGHAITAKTAKLNKKLKMIDLQLKKAKLDADLNDGDGPTKTGTGVVIDRNELLAKLANRDQSNKTD
jgi:hypothetical protein